ncbi:MAG: peptidylprolyl isomerase [Methanotrichaceae archaeon]|nr:peptidylprolyl isomerase [Methanotrichaceae archaeon]
MVQAKAGDIVEVHYTGKLDDDVPFESSRGGEPLQFCLGEGRMIEGFEEAVIGMSPGERKTVAIPPEKGFGLYREDLVISVDLKDLPPDLAVVEGMSLEICEDDGKGIQVQVTEIEEGIATLDANHPLAQQTVTFEIELLTISKGAEGETSSAGGST